MSPSRPQTWQLKAAQKRLSIMSQYPVASRLSHDNVTRFLESHDDLRGANDMFLDEKSLHIINLSAYERWERLQSRSLTAVVSTEASLKSIAVGDQLVQVPFQHDILQTDR